MTQEQLEQVLAGVHPTERRIYEVLKQHGVLTGPDFRTAGPTFVRNDSMTSEILRLRHLGLIEEVGKRKSRASGHPAMAYRVVPLRKVERARERALGLASQPQPKRRSARARADDLGKMEVGDWAEWYRVRRRVLQLTDLLISIEPMAFWKMAPEDDIDAALPDLIELITHAEDVVMAMRTRLDDRGVREKIASMRNTTGRTPEETETFLRMADKWEQKLLT